MLENLRQFILFSRLHTIIGTTLSVSVLFLIAWFLAPPSPLPVILWLESLIACLGANIYIVGL
ncbi:MAG: homogentisate phytyltransferase, partial [Bacteroidota bacterium]